MIHTVTVDTRAEADITNARRWYRQQGKHLAVRFVAEVRHSLREIQEAPLRWSEWRRPFRRYLLQQFPYVVFYRTFDRQILVVAVLHQHQDADARFPEDP